MFKAHEDKVRYNYNYVILSDYKDKVVDKYINKHLKMFIISVYACNSVTVCYKLSID